MIERILKATGASLFAVMFVLGGAMSASATLIEPGGSETFAGADEVYVADLTNLAPADKLSQSFFEFEHVYTFEVTGGDKSIENIYDSLNEPPTGFFGISNLTYSWSTPLVTEITDVDGIKTVGSLPLVFVDVLSAGIYTLTVTGTTLKNGGSYSLILTAVPIPAAALLFGSALLGGGLLRRRKMIKEFGLPA